MFLKENPYSNENIFRKSKCLKIHIELKNKRANNVFNMAFLRPVFALFLVSIQLK